MFNTMILWTKLFHSGRGTPWTLLHHANNDSYLIRDQQWLNVCPICHMANMDAAVHLLPHVWTTVAADGLQHRHLLCDIRDTHWTSVNCHTQFRSYITVLSNSFSKIYISGSVCFFCGNPVYSFISMCRMRRFLVILRGSFHSPLLCKPSLHPILPATLPSFLTLSCHLFLEPCILLFVLFCSILVLLNSGSRYSLPSYFYVHFFMMVI